MGHCFPSVQHFLLFSRTESEIVSSHAAAGKDTRSCFLVPDGRVTSVRLRAVHARELLLALIRVHAPHVENVVVDVVVEDLQSGMRVYV